jgi:hypothetical protein
MPLLLETILRGGDKGGRSEMFDRRVRRVEDAENWVHRWGQSGARCTVLCTPR